MARGNMGKVLKAGAVKESGKGVVSAKQAAGSMADVEGIEIIQDNTDLILSEFPTAINKALEEIGLLAEGHVIGYITDHYIVDTGRLRNSITHTIDNGESVAIIGTNVEYAPYVHFGTKRSKKGARPFLVEPVSQHAGDYRAIAEKALKGA